jgi:hypothetical protein
MKSNCQHLKWSMIYFSLTLKGVCHIYIIPLDELKYEERVLPLGHMTQVAR